MEEASEAVAPGQNESSEEEVQHTVEAEQIASAETATLTALLQQEARNRRKEERSAFVWGVGFVTLMLFLASRTFTDPSSLFRNMALSFALMTAYGAAMCVHFYRRSHRRKRSLTGALSTVQDMKQVGPLVRAVQVQNMPVRHLAKTALIPILPTMKASDAPLLGEGERKILLRVLAISPDDLGYRDLTELFSQSAYRREVEFRVSILKALEQIGGANELATVERLARGLPTMYSAAKVPAQVREAANQCLPFLQARAQEQRASTQLLRASSADTTANDVLLRPASARDDALPEQLLRAGDPNT